MNVQLQLVEVYRTTISSSQQAHQLKCNILSRFPDLHINFDLQDCDNILRIVYEDELDRPEVEEIANKLGVLIEVLDY